MLKRITFTLILTITTLTTTPALASQKPSQPFKCPQAMKVALKAGWKRHHLPQLDMIIYRETGRTCRNNLIGWNYTTGKDHRDCPPRKRWQTYRKCRYVKSADFGYTQINDKTWVSYLRQRKIITEPKQLFHPRTNLVAAKALYDYAVDRGINGWTAWATNKPDGSGTGLK